MNSFDVGAEQSGNRQVRERLEGLEAELQRRAIRAGLTRGSKPILDTMHQLVPVQSGSDGGELKQSLGRRQLSKNARGRLGLAEGTVAMRIGPIKKVNGYSQAYVGRLVEHGVEPSTRKVFRRIGGTHRLKRRHAHIRSYTYQHPGQPATHFMRRSLQQGGAEFENKFYAGMANYLRRKGY